MLGRFMGIGVAWSLLATAFVAVAREADAPAGQSPAEPGSILRVLVIDSEGPTRPAFVRFMEGFREGVAESEYGQPEVYIENLDVVRLERSVDDPERAAGWLIEKYSDCRFDVIVPTSAVARDFAVASRERLSPEARIVAFERPGDALPAGAVPRDYTSVTSEPTVDETVSLACRLLPGLKRIYLLGQREFHPASWALYDAGVRRCAEERGLEYVALVDLGLAELRHRLRDLPADSAVVYFAYWKDEFGRMYFPSELLESLCLDSRAPVFGMLDTHVGRGTVGGACGDLRAMGEATGRLVVADRERPLPPPVVVPPVVLLDDRALDRFHVPASRVPAGTRVLFREPRLWDHYWPQLIAGGAVLALQSLLIVALVTQSRLRRRAEQIVDEQRDQIAHAGRVSTLGELAASLAHELGQPLGAILNNLEAAEILLRDDDSANAAELRAIVRDMAVDDERAGAVLDRIRAMIRRQRFTVGPVDVPGLVRGVLTLFGPRLATDGVVVTVACESALPRVAGDEILLQQALLNLLGNSTDAIRSSRATASEGALGAAERRDPGAITIRARREGDTVELSVIDDGGGIGEGMLEKALDAFATTKDEGLGMGLPIARSIIERHGGRLRLDNAPGRGLTVFMTVPIWKEETST